MDEPFVFQHDKGLLKFSFGVLPKMLEFSQTSAEAPESGGILLGRLIIGREDIVIDEVTTPMTGDQRSRFAFVRSSFHHQSILNDKWRFSHGTCNYLGEWHTHAEPTPKPSARDIKSWQSQCQRLPKGRECLYFVIVGTESFTVWKAYRKPFKIQQLNQI